VNGTVTADEHNAGNVAHMSPYTSWTRHLPVATCFAVRHGPGGVVLCAPTGAPPGGAGWRWAMSIDTWWETEILLWGVRSGLKVLQL
jgi:hypothetical protein